MLCRYKSIRVVVSWFISNWIVTSCKLHRFTTGQSNSFANKYIFQNSSHIYVNPSSSQIHKINIYTNIQQSIYTDKSNTNFSVLVPFIKSLQYCPFFKKHMRLGHAGIINHPIQFINTRLEKNIKEEWTENKF